MSARTSQVLCQYVTDTEASQRFAPMIEKDLRVGPKI